jgi:hypothetical protein
MQAYQVRFRIFPHSTHGPVVLQCQVVGDEQTLRMTAFESPAQMANTFRTLGILPARATIPDLYSIYEVCEDQLCELGLTLKTTRKARKMQSMRIMGRAEMYSTRRIVAEIERRAEAEGIECLTDLELNDELQRRTAETQMAQESLAQQYESLAEEETVAEQPLVTIGRASGR